MPSFLDQRTIRELQRAAQAALEKAAPTAAKFEYANVDPAGTGDFILIGSDSPLSITKTALRCNQAQALAICQQICGTLATLMVSNDSQLQREAMPRNAKPEGQPE